MEYLQQNWLVLVVLILGVGLGARWLWDKVRRKTFSRPLLLAIIALLLAGIGGLGFVPMDVGMWTTFGALGTLAVLLLIVISTGTWNAYLGYLVGAVLLFGTGAWVLGPLGQLIGDAGKFVVTLVPLEPWWLLLLLLIPVTIWLSFRSLSGLGPIRRWLAIGLRCLGITLLALALAETHARKQDENVTVLFAWDRSLSIPPEQNAEGDEDLRKQRIMNFINESVRKRAKQGDRA
jgi:hypothetical protein